MTIKSRYDIEDIVYLKTDTDQNPQMITAITIRPGGTIVYELSSGTDTSDHYEFEISRQVDNVLKTR